MAAGSPRAGWRLELRWSARELGRRWGLVLATAAIIAIGTGVFAGLGGTTPWRIASLDASYAQLGYHDLRVILPEGAYAPQGSLEAAARGIPDAGAVTATAERLVVPAQLDASTASGRTVLVAGRIVGADPASRLDRLRVVSGRAPGGGDQPPTALLESKFATARGLPGTGTITVSGGRPVRYTGLGYSPEYFRIIGTPGQLTSEKDFAVLFTSLPAAQLSSGHPGQVNDLVLGLAPGADVTAVTAQLRSALSAVGGRVATREDDAVYHFSYADARNDQKIWNFLAVLILLGASFAAFNLISRMVDAQRHEIGIGMALGAPPARLARRPLMAGLEVAVLGALAGVGVGLFAADRLRAVLQNYLTLPTWKVWFPTGRYVEGVLLGVGLPMLATLLPVRRAIRVEPVRALQTGPRGTREAGLAPLLRRVQRGERVVSRLPLRSLLRAPRRTAFTALGIAAAMTSLVALLGILDSVVGAFDRSDVDLARSSPQRMQVTLDSFYPLTSPQLAAIRAAPAVGRAEPGLSLPGTATAHGHRLDLLVQTVDMERGMWTPRVIAGARPGPGGGIVMSTKAANDLGVRVGETIMLGHPRREGSGFAVVQTPVRVAALHANPLRFLAYLETDQASLYGLTGAANTVTVLPARGSTQDDVRRSLFARPAVASVEPVARVGNLVKDRISQIESILRLLEGFALGLVLLIAFNSARIGMDERAREQATMFAFGLPVGTVLRLAVIESVLTGLLGTVIGLGTGLLALGWLVHIFSTDTIPEVGTTTFLSAGSLAATFALGIVAVALAPVLAAARLSRMDIPGTLRVLE